MALYASFILPILNSLWGQQPRAPVGIVNTGKSTCYLSCILQSLGHVPLVAILTPDVWKSACGCPSHSHCWLCYPSVWIAGRSADSWTSKLARPVWALERLHNFLFDSSQPRLTRNRPAASSSHPEPDEVDWTSRRFTHQDPDELMRTWTSHVDSKDKPEGCSRLLQHLLGSTMVNERCCSGCSVSRSVSKESTIILPQHVADGVLCTSVEQGLDFKSATSLLHDYKCGHCGRKDTCQEQSLFQALPNVLVLSLPRTEYTFTGARKLKHHIAFPEVLDLAPWTHPASPDLGVGSEYDLVSVVQHHGKQAGGGHCTATCRTAAADGSLGEYFQFNDEVVTKRTLDEVLGIEACMLWYQRRQPRQSPIPTYKPTEVLLTKVPSSSSSNSWPAPIPADPVAAAPPAPLRHVEPSPSPPLPAGADPSSPSSPSSVPRALPRPVPLLPGGAVYTCTSSSPPSAPPPLAAGPCLPPGVDCVQPLPFSHPSPPSLLQPVGSPCLSPAFNHAEMTSSSQLSQSPSMPPAAPAALPPADSLPQRSSSISSPSLATAPQSSSSVPSLAPPSPQPPSPSSLLSPSSSSAAHTGRLTDVTQGHVGMPGTASPPSQQPAPRGLPACAHAGQCQHGGSSSMLPAHDADTMPIKASYPLPQQHSTTHMDSDAVPMSSADETGGCGNAHLADVPCAANSASASDCSVAHGESAAASPTVPYTRGDEIEALPNSSKPSERPLSACPQNSPKTGAAHQPVKSTLHGGNASLRPISQESMSSRIQPKVAGPANQPRTASRPETISRPRTRSQTRLANAQATGRSAAPADTAVTSPEQQARSLQPTGRVSKATGKAVGKACAKAASTAAGKAVMSKRKRADQDVTYLPEQPTKRQNITQADPSIAASSMPAGSALPAGANKRKRAQDAPDCLPAQPSKRSNTTQDDTGTAFRSAAAPRRSARQTKKVNYCELEDTDMTEASDFKQSVPKGGRKAKGKNASGTKAVRVPWR